tara:strand:+ start:406 stop:675 length:270 start_codon:yes stop_codon:yes gene_type:complete
MRVFLLVTAGVIAFAVFVLLVLGYSVETFTPKGRQEAIRKAYDEMRNLEDEAINCISNNVNTRRNRIRHTRIRNRIIALENYIARLSRA